MKVADKVVVVTGAAQGLGRAFTKALIEHDAKVCMSDVNDTKGKESCIALKEEFSTAQVHFIKCDVTKREDMINLFDETERMYGSVDIVVNNAGVIQERDWNMCVDINLKGVIQGTMLALEHMQKGRGGVIINVASVAGLVAAYPLPVYTATKHGVVGFTNSWAVNPDVTKAGIRLACLCPSFTDTPLLNIEQDQLIQWSSIKEIQSSINKYGINTLEMVADGFIQLVEDEASNGATMTVSVDKGIEISYVK